MAMIAGPEAKMHVPAESDLTPPAWTVASMAFLVLIAATLLVIDLTILPSRFYDYDTYLLYLDNIYYFRQPDWFVFEGLAKLYMLFLRELAGTTEGAVKIAHYLLLAIFLPGFFALFRRTPWEAAVIAAALFAPQLGLVTIRATPAYILCGFAAIRAIERRPGAFWLALLSTIFHVSGFLALIPIVGTMIIGRTKLANYNFRLSMVLGVGFVLAIFSIFFAQALFDALTDLFNATPYLQKYSAYAVGLADPSAVVSQGAQEPTSANHYVFMVGSTILILAVVFFEQRRTLLKIYAALSFILYLGIFFAFSPIPAFRFAPFFALPVLSLVRFPERLTPLRGLAALPLLTTSLVVFAVQVSLVID